MSGRGGTVMRVSIKEEFKALCKNIERRGKNATLEGYYLDTGRGKKIIGAPRKEGTN